MWMRRDTASSSAHVLKHISLTASCLRSDPQRVTKRYVLASLDPRASTVCVLNPLRSEDEAFRFLLYAIAVIAAIVALVLIVRAIV